MLVEYDLTSRPRKRPYATPTLPPPAVGRPVAVATRRRDGWPTSSAGTKSAASPSSTLRLLSAAGAMFATATAGSVNSAADAGDQILNARLSTAVGTPAAGQGVRDDHASVRARADRLSVPGRTPLSEATTAGYGASYPRPFSRNPLKETPHMDEHPSRPAVQDRRRVRAPHLARRRAETTSSAEREGRPIHDEVIYAEVLSPGVARQYAALSNASVSATSRNESQYADEPHHGPQVRRVQEASCTTSSRPKISDSTLAGTPFSSNGRR
jgi:hypothetical protein